jgi:hypothetical protein
MKHLHSRFCLPIIILTALFLAACSTPAERAQMTPQTLDFGAQHPYSLKVQTSGGAQTGAMDSSNISDADLKAAIEEAVVTSKLFKAIVKGSDGDYELTVNITSLSKPVFGTTFTVELETAWTLTKVSDRSVVMRKAIQSTGKATMGDALVAVTRLRLAVEGAARDNINQGLVAIAKHKL